MIVNGVHEGLMIVNGVHEGLVVVNGVHESMTAMTLQPQLLGLLGLGDLAGDVLDGFTEWALNAIIGTTIAVVDQVLNMSSPSLRAPAARTPDPYGTSELDLTAKLRQQPRHHRRHLILTRHRRHQIQRVAAQQLPPVRLVAPRWRKVRSGCQRPMSMMIRMVRAATTAATRAATRRRRKATSAAPRAAEKPTQGTTDQATTVTQRVRRRS